MCIRERKKNPLKLVFITVFYPVVWLRRRYYSLRNVWLAKHCPQKWAGLRYKYLMGRKIDWKKPLDINAKIQWLKFYGDRALWARCADKYAVRQYVKEKGCSELLVTLYGKWDKAEDIDWDSLPNEFILKMNNGSGGNYICKDKGTLDIPAVTKMFHDWLLEPYGYMSVEPHYSDIKPCIIAEELLDASKQDIVSSSLVDYKIFAFNGEPLYIWVCHNRKPNKVQVATYDTQWNYRPEKSVFNSVFVESSVPIPKPKCFDEMLKVASVLSKGHPQVRVDLYVVNNKCYFGELTFTSLGGFMDFFSKEMLDEMGEKTDLSIVKRN